MRRHAAALALSLLLATGVAACGGDDSETSDVVPKSTPDLVAPEDTGLPAAPASGDGDDETSTSTSTSTTSTGEAPAAQAPSTPVTPAPEQAAPDAGGQQAPPANTQAQPEEDAGGNSGGFSDFCAENPGACPDE